MFGEILMLYMGKYLYYNYIEHVNWMNKMEYNIEATGKGCFV